MATVCKILLLVVLVGFLTSHVDAGWGDCYATWSRCSRWSSWFTGKVWLNCNDRCKQLGRRGGRCVLSRSTCPISSKAYQCRCY